MLEFLFIGAAVGAGAAVATFQTKKEAISEHLRAVPFRRVYERVIPPDGATCLLCGKAMDVTNTKIIFYRPSSKAPAFVCDSTTCLLAHYQGVAKRGTQKVLT